MLPYVSILDKVPKVCVAKKRFPHVAMLCGRHQSANAILPHYLGLVFSLELLQTITLSQTPPEDVIHSKSN